MVGRFGWLTESLALAHVSKHHIVCMLAQEFCARCKHMDLHPCGAHRGAPCSFCGGNPLGTGRRCQRRSCGAALHRAALSCFDAFGHASLLQGGCGRRLTAPPISVECRRQVTTATVGHLLTDRPRGGWREYGSKRRCQFVARLCGPVPAGGRGGGMLPGIRAWRARVGPRTGLTPGGDTHTQSKQ